VRTSEPASRRRGPMAWLTPAPGIPGVLFRFGSSCQRRSASDEQVCSLVGPWIGREASQHERGWLIRIRARCLAREDRMLAEAIRKE